MRASTPGGRLQYVPALDGLRGVAIAAVVGYHAFGWPRGGWIGVDLFFVLSGFLITTLLLEQGTGLRAFYVRRARRLLPALVALLAGYLVIAAARGAGGLTAVIHSGFYTGNVYEAFWPGASKHLDGLNHLWSLAEEEQFYLVWPAALLFVRKARRPAFLLGALAATLMLYRIALANNGASDARVYFAPDTNVDGLVLGAALAFRPVGSVSRRRIAAAVLVAAPILVWIPSTAVLDAYTLPLVELVALTLVAAAVSGSLRLPHPLVSLGRISYSLYLWHFVVLWALDWRHPVLAVVVSVAVAWASTTFVERPLQRWRRPPAAQPVLREALGT